ncbi:MAG: hypothetical protein UT96_C0040G0011 [Candidatus Woesebacteria bacterium GW2011_GWC2_40_30]|nr:MAG: hypothetical protein UT96_C0040G0011 [Candidatus Woesebacteria bacterium GW2011_GWC2_40_30]
MVEGNLAGTDTTIIVQFLGTSLNGETGSISEAKAKGVAATIEPKSSIAPKPTLASTPIPTPVPIPTAAPPQVTTSESAIAFVSPFSSTKGISLLVTGILLMVLSIDFIVVKHKRIVRVGGRTFAHIAYLGMILAVILILKAGQII